MQPVVLGTSMITVYDVCVRIHIQITLNHPIVNELNGGIATVDPFTGVEKLTISDKIHAVNIVT
jgi:hypothetical protein